MSSPSSTTLANSTSDPAPGNYTTTTAASRLAFISAHMSAPKPPVTCHVLDTSTGKPAAGIPCTLSRFYPADGSNSSSPTEIARAVTNGDGRVVEWEVTLKGALQWVGVAEGTMYKIRFDTWDHFGGETFFPYVEVVFTVKDPSQHYHIPLLLAPYSYTTYRGS